MRRSLAPRIGGSGSSQVSRREHREGLVESRLLTVVLTALAGMSGAMVVG